MWAYMSLPRELAVACIINSRHYELQMNYHHCNAGLCSQSHRVLLRQSAVCISRPARRWLQSYYRTVPILAYLSRNGGNGWVTKVWRTFTHLNAKLLKLCGIHLNDKLLEICLQMMIKCRKIRITINMKMLPEQLYVRLFVPHKNKIYFNIFFLNNK